MPGLNVLLGRNSMIKGEPAKDRDDEPEPTVNLCNGRTLWCVLGP
jgi:hypothetical protein